MQCQQLLKMSDFVPHFCQIVDPQGMCKHTLLQPGKEKQIDIMYVKVHCVFKTYMTLSVFDVGAERYWHRVAGAYCCC